MMLHNPIFLNVKFWDLGGCLNFSCAVGSGMFKGFFWACGAQLCFLGETHIEFLMMSPPSAGPIKIVVIAQSQPPSDALRESLHCILKKRLAGLQEWFQKMLAHLKTMTPHKGSPSVPNRLFLSDPGLPWVRSMGPGVSNWTNVWLT